MSSLAHMKLMTKLLLVVHVLTGSAIKKVEEPEYLRHITYYICLFSFPQPFLPKHLLQKKVVSFVTLVTDEVMPNLKLTPWVIALKTCFLVVTSWCLILWFWCPNRAYWGINKETLLFYNGFVVEVYYNIHCLVINEYFVNALLWRCM